MLKLYNTLTRKIEDFAPLNPPKVGMYSCGLTVYDYAHIGNLRRYVGDDILRRVLEANGYQVKHVMNITDVGHLVSDEDEGEDKLEKGARERGESVWEIAKFFENYFLKSLRELNIKYPSVVPRATEHIKEQIKLIERLEKNGFTYKTGNAIFFDVSKFPDYTKLTGQNLEEKKVGAREETVIDKEKKNPFDFVLWFLTVGKYENHAMKWPSPWGEGFPGWHIECSAMSMEYLGNTLDIHTGGIDHLTVHHPNEIAQSEAATGQQFVRFWVHHGWLLVNGEKMSKSKKNFYRTDELKERGFDPLTLRYLVLTSHYRDKLNFTWESLEAAQNALNNLREEIRGWVLMGNGSNGLLGQIKDDVAQFWQEFLDTANNDLNMPQALAVMWKMVKSGLPTSTKSATLLQMDKVLGLKLDEYVGKPLEIPAKVQKLVDAREEAKRSKDFNKSDELRHQIKKLGFEVEDTSSGPKLKKS